MNFLQGTISRWSDLVFPPVCLFCETDLLLDRGKSGVATERDVRLCESCRSRLKPAYRQRCRRCGAGIEMPGSVSSLIPPVVDRCTFCRRQQPVYDVAYSLGNYEQDLREAILKCKSGHHDGLVMALSRILAAAVPGEDLDFVVPMPIHWRRRLGRVTVVSELMASEISLVLGIPVVRALRCRRLTQKQGRLSTRERIKNMRRAFECRIRAAKIHQKNILLVDDVMTSGATSNEAAWELRRAGAETVQVAILARGIGRSSR